MKIHSIQDNRPVWQPAILWLAPVLALVLGPGSIAASAHAAPGATRLPLPPPVINARSTEICMNSRISYHGGWNSATTEQMLANVLHATARVPVTSTPITIYAATAQNVYVYDAAGHSLTVHKAGDYRSDASAGFEVGVAAGNMVDAGGAIHLAQLESIALWTGTTSQLASCPRASAVTYANNNWNPAEPVDIVTSFGIRTVAGMTTTLVAISSDGSLPNPATDGSVFMDDVLESLAYDSTFAATDLSLAEISQMLWASYGCSNHYASGGKAGLVCASAVANYYLTRRIYAVGPDAVHRFHNRLPPGTGATTRDHRIELVTAGDMRPALRAQVPGLPTAPYYLIICLGTTGSWQELEAGFAACGAVLEASAMGLQGYLTADLSSGVQAGIRAATGIPSTDIPWVVVSLGQPSDAADAGTSWRAEDSLSLLIEGGIAFGDRVALRYALPLDAAVELDVFDCLGQKVRSLIDSQQAKGSRAAIWDCRDDRGRPVLSGVYFCRLNAEGRAAGARVVIVR